MVRIVKALRFPETILQEMHPWMKKCNLNFTAFIMEAIRNYIQVLKYREEVRKSYGAWKKEEHPELEKGTAQYVRKMRESRFNGTF